MIILQFLGEFVLTLLAIDFVSGLVHWAEDTFGTEQTPLLGKWIVIPNVKHHEDPSEFTHKSWLHSSWDLLVATVIIALVCWYFDRLTWHVWLFCILGANANQLHKYAHLPEKSTPFFVLIFVKLRILQSAKNHAFHHTGEKNKAYCVITPYLNPILDSIGFWRFLEKIWVPILGAPRREDLKK